MKIREITTNLYEAPTLGQSLNGALTAGANRLRNAVGAPRVPNKVDSIIKTLKNTTYCVIFIKPIADYFLNMEHWEQVLKDKPADLEQRRQIERGYLITELATIAGTLTMGDVGIFLLSELFGVIPIIGPILGRLFKILGPAVQSAAMLWLSSDAGRTAISNLLATLVDVKIEDVPGYGSDIVDMFKKGFEWAKKHVEQGYHDITTPTDPNAPKPDAGKTDTLADTNAKPKNDPWAIKPNTPPQPKKPRLDPSEMNQIVAPTDDSAYTSLDRVVRDANGKLQLK